MNQLQIFSNKEFGSLPIVYIENKVYFGATESATTLGYVNPHDAISKHCKKEGVAFHEVLSNGGPQRKKFINEGNLYRLISRSKLPSAEKFESWVFDEVIPTIRKTGGYVANDDLFIQTYLPQADEQTKQLFKVTLHTMKEQSKQIETMKPKALFADAVESSESSVLVGELAKILKQNGVDIGQNKLFKWLRENGYLIRKKGESFNLPTQRSMDMGLFEIKKSTIVNGDGSIRTTRTPKVTGKGQIYFVNKFIKSQSA
ncbi:phage antirepressor KilAC domain-containing protein [Bacillus licheniformis]|uniref:phage antirepressor n=2 Tax=Bacillus licheniformis TaxID=1402 RepID=UPI002E1EC56E|nr:phage antirepressor KilAC domain-containing protein [Bacillus licheniformis]MED4326733.1 phage antirepressor KilAC domain-containing protein [Bacillus licheniformis]